MIFNIALVLCVVLVVLLVIASLWITKKEKELGLIEEEDDG